MRLIAQTIRKAFTFLLSKTTKISIVYIFLLAALFLPQLITAQEGNFISGKVVDEKTGLPVAGCSVYISNTSKGDITSATGEFVLNKLPIGKYELVVSAIGYESEVIPVSSNEYPHQLKINLRIRSSELSEVTVRPSLTNGWEKWGQTFIDNFIGTIPSANQCHIKNHEVIKFWYSEKNNRLTAHADEPIIIENEALGYIIKFNLEDFSADFDTKIFSYIGHPFFQEMPSSNEKKKSKWVQNRKEVFYGSLLDFMRCGYNERWLSAGYMIITHVMRPNAEKLRVKKIMETSKDSTAYYKKVLKQADSLSEYVSLKQLDSMLITENEETKSLYFTDKIVVVYKRFPQSKSQQQSVIYLATPEPVHIMENGNYFSPRELVTGEHWALYEKVANMLPFDYEP